ncbi:cation:proton antiporter [Streptomyces sp. NPDC003023]|uniref:cation:proton antiporter n=1 Tax=Streptomyces sp. NPDC003023 TaxID=3364675 RepID=UPI0036901968
MSQTDLFRVLAALALLVAAAHLGGRLFARFRQPPVVGELLGGLLLGPTVLGLLLPEVQSWLFPATGPAASGLTLVHQIGMLLLMFTAGMEMRTVFSRGDGRSVAVIAVAGMAVPFVLGLVVVRAVDTADVMGPAADVPALTLVVACAVAVTSIPVISRIMLDLGIVRTRFARIVLSVAVVEDIVLNVVLSVALGMVAGGREDGFGLAGALGVTSAHGSAVYHLVASVAFFGLMMLAAAALRRRPGAGAGTAGSAQGRVAVRMAAVLAASAACVFLGVAPMFGAFVVGLLSGMTGQTSRSESLGHVRGFASGFFVPVYFAIVGLELDLVHSFDPVFTAGFILVACAAKAVSVYGGARLAGRPGPESLDLSVALNARGGPGIVLATVSFDAGIVNASLFTTLVLTAVVTSQIAGWWLGRAVARGVFAPVADGRDTGPRPDRRPAKPVDALTG